jgi:hypothetical protein
MSAERLIRSTARRKGGLRMRLRNAYRVAFANLQLYVEEGQNFWAVRISDLGERETLYQARSATASEAKTAAVNFALVRLFGPSHTKDSRMLAESLSWCESS